MPGGGGLTRILGRCKSDYKGCLKAFRVPGFGGCRVSTLNPKV